MGTRVAELRLAKRKSSDRPRDREERQQVAAVCYRIGVQGLQFLLVQTRGGRWIFPKGGVEPGLTQAQSAALEAFEEAGVHGRIEEMAFARYRLDQCPREADKESRQAARSAENRAVTAHLCEVSHLEPPQEANRRPTWFSVQKAKRRLLEDRNAEFGGDLARVVDRAVARIQRKQISSGHEFRKDALQKVRFEAFEDFGPNAALMRHFLLDQRGRGAGQVEGQARLLKGSRAGSRRG